MLLDVAAVKGRWLDAGEGVMPEDLEAAEKAQGVRVEPGDILLVRTGYYGRRRAEGRAQPGQGRLASGARRVAAVDPRALGRDARAPTLTTT